MHSIHLVHKILAIHKQKKKVNPKIILEKLISVLRTLI